MPWVEDLGLFCLEMIEQHKHQWNSAIATSTRMRCEHCCRLCCWEQYTIAKRGSAIKS